MNNFELISSFTSDFNGVQLKKFRSTKTGLSPLVHGFFVLATEAHDNDGCPHTLEHLIFLGSEDYPYKGVLDLLANRAFATGTNAWTDVDHTCYTITTAGSEGFLNLLPIYLDHILFPTLTYEGYYTEIHHINGKGENSGVVYSEMQGRQNSMRDRLQFVFQRLLYPDSGYQSETGGLMENLRELKVDTIRNYHSKFYVPSNLCCVIVGNLSEKELLEKLDIIDQKILTKPFPPNYERPWVNSPLKSLSASAIEIVEFPDDEEAVGTVKIGFRGPSINNHFEKEALEIVNMYLTESSTSLLQKEFVECNDPFAADVSIDFLKFIELGIDVQFDGVPKEKLKDIKTRFFDVLHKHFENGVDMKRMKMLLSKRKKQLMDSSESNLESFFLRPCIEDILYGSTSGSTLSQAFLHLEYLKKLEVYSSDEWLQFFKKNFNSNLFICVIGMPSAAFAEKLQKDEQERVEAQRKRIGEEGLKKLQIELDKAKSVNETKIPGAVLDSFPIPSTQKVLDNLIQVKSLTSTKYDDRMELEPKSSDADIGTPFHIEFDHIKSNFIEVSFLIDTFGLDEKLRVYLELFLDSFFNLPLMMDGVEIKWEDVVDRLESETTKYFNSVGIGSRGSFNVGSFPQFILMNLKAEKENYQKLLSWIKNLMFASVPTVERLLASANKILNSIPDYKREGMFMCSEYLKNFLFSEKNSNQTALFILKQHKVLSDVVEGLKGKETSLAILKEIQELRKNLFTSDKLMFHVAGNLNHVEKALSSFSILNFPFKMDVSPITVRYSSEFLVKDLKKVLKKFFVIPMPSIESSFVLHCTPGPKGFVHEDLPACMVLTEYLSTMEGLLWKEVRGAGLAYGANLKVSPESGLIFFTIYRSPDGYKAFEAVKKLLSSKVEIEERMIESAKSSVIYSIVSKEDSPFSAASETYIRQVLKKVGQSGNKNLISSISNVTKGDIERCLEEYLRPLFQAEKSAGAICTIPNKAEEYVSKFKDLGYETEIHQLQ